MSMLWTPGYGPTIPIIDGFEDNNINEYSQNNYNDPEETNSVNVQSSTVWDGSHAVDILVKPDSKFHAGDYSIISTSGLDNYPSSGDIFSVWLQTTNDCERIQFLFGMQGTGHPTDTNSGYGIYFNHFNTEIVLCRYDSGSVTSLASTSQSTSLNTWYELYVDWGSGGTITFILKDSGGSNLASVNSTDSNYTSGGIGWRNKRLNTTGENDLYGDYAIIKS